MAISMGQIDLIECGQVAKEGEQQHDHNQVLSPCPGCRRCPCHGIGGRRLSMRLLDRPLNPLREEFGKGTDLLIDARAI